MCCDCDVCVGASQTGRHLIISSRNSWAPASTTMQTAPAPLPPSSLLVETRATWISPGTVLRIPVPVAENNKFLFVDFEVLSGRYCDFDVMLEDEDESAERLYGPSRRASAIRTCLPLPKAGMLHVNFDNYNSFVSSVQIRYSLRLLDEEPDDQTTVSRLRAGDMVGPTPGSEQAMRAEAVALEEAEEEEEVRRALATSKPREVLVAAGANQEIELIAHGPTNLYVSLDVVRGRDVDFGVMLLCEEDGEIVPIRIFGPCRRASNFSANISVPCAGRVVLGFDNSGSWVYSKTVQWRAAFADESSSGAML